MDESSSELVKYHEKSDKIAIENDICDFSTLEAEELSIDLLAPRSPPFIKDFIILYTKENHLVIKNETKKKCKILKITPEWSYDEVLMEIAKLDPKIYENLFIFILEFKQGNIHFTDGKDEILPKFLLKFSENRPLIIQISSEGTSKFYYKEEFSKTFHGIKKASIQSEDFEDFQSFFLTFMEQKFGDFENSMIQNLPQAENSSLILRFFSTLDCSEELFEDLTLECGKYGSKSDLLAVLDVPFNQKEIAECSKTNVLGIRFRFANSVMESVLFNALTESNDEILDFLIKDCTHFIKNLPFDHQVDISTLAFTNNCIPLLCDLLEFCDFPFPKNFNPKSATDERLQKIIEFRTNLHKVISDGKKEVVDEYIQANVQHKIFFNTQNDSALYQALNSRKFSLFYHLKSLGFCAVEFEKSQTLINDKDKCIAKRLASIQRMKNIDSALGLVDKTVTVLSLKSFIHNKDISDDSKNKYNSKMRKWLTDINKINDLSPVLDVSAQCDELKIIYDFKSLSSDTIDLSDERAEGVTYPTNKWIMVGADYSGGREREQCVKSVLIHEIFHYSMRLVFENDEKPYFKEDKEAEMEFTEITNEINKWKCEDDAQIDDGCCGIISIVFLRYPMDEHQIELIVRVGHILAKYDDDAEKTAQLREQYQRLFEFHRNRVIPHLQKFKLKERENIRKLNKAAKLLPTIQELKYELAEPKDVNTLIENPTTVVTTNVPKLFFLNVYKSFKEKYGNLVNVKNIFITAESLKDPDMQLQLKEIMTYDLNLNIFVDCSNGIDEILKHLTVKNESKLIIVTSCTDQSLQAEQTLMNMKLNPKIITIHFNWCDLSKESQSSLLQTKVSFQKKKVSLMDLISKNSVTKADQNKACNEDFSDVISEQLLNALINKSKMIINNQEDDKDKEYKNFETIFKPRNFLKKYKIIESLESFNDENVERMEKGIFEFTSIFHFNSMSTEIKSKSKKQLKVLDKTEQISQEKLFKDIKGKKFVLISDEAGTGKSWVIKNIANILQNKNKPKWISVVDLKQFIHVFKSGQKVNFKNFIVQNILKTRSQIDTNVFLKMYKHGNCCIFFDGFDEIAPDCADYLMSLIHCFKFNGGNQLWIATRDYFQKDLKEKLEVENVFKLASFTHQDGVDIIVSNWILNDLENEGNLKRKKNVQELIKTSPNYETYREKAQALNKKISELKNNSIGIPQFYKMIAEITKNDKDGIIEITIFKIYAKFVKIQYERWSYGKGQLRKNASIEIQTTYILGFQELHQFFAMHGFYGEIFCFCDLEFDASEWSEEEIIACGLLTKRGQRFFFIHETFREYFAAQFILRILMKGGRKVDEDFCRFFTDFLTIQKYGVIRVFLNEAFSEAAVAKKIDQKIGAIAKFFFQNVENLESLSEIFEKNLENIESIVHKIFEYGKYEDVKKILFNSIETEDEYTENRISCPKFIKLASKFLNVDDIKSLLISNDKNGSKFIHHVMLYNKLDEIQESFEILKEILNDAEYQEVLKSIDSIGIKLLKNAMLSLKDIKTCEFLWQLFGKSWKSNREFSNVFLKYETKNYNILNLAVLATTSEIFDFLIKILEELTTFENIKNLILNLGSMNNNVLQVAAGNNKDVELHKSLWTTLQKYLNKSEIKQMIQHENKYNHNLFHLALGWNTKEVVEFIWSEILNFEDLVNRNELLELLQKETMDDKNIIHFCVFSKDIEKLKFMWDRVFSYFQEHKSTDKFKNMLLQQDSECENVLHTLANCHDIDYHEFFWTLLVETLENIEDLTSLLFQESYRQQRFLDALTARSSAKIIQRTFEILKTIFSDIQYEEILKSKSSFENNVLQTAVITQRDVKVHQVLWKEFKQFYGSTQKLQFLEIFKEIDKQSFNILQSATYHTSDEIFEFIIEELEKVASRQEIKEILSINDEYESNLLKIAASNNPYLNFYGCLWKTFRKYFDFIEIIDFITQPDKGDKNLLWHIANAIISKTLEIFWKEIKQSLMAESSELLKSTFDECDFYVSQAASKKTGKYTFTSSHVRIYHFEAEDFSENSTETSTSRLISKFENLSKILIAESAQKTLENILKWNHFPENFKDFHRFSYCNKIELHCKFWDFLLKNCENLHTVFDMLQTNRFGNNFLHNIMDTGRYDIIEYTIKVFKENFTPEQYDQLLKSKCKNGMDILHKAIYSEDIKILQFIWTTLQSLFKSNQEILEMISETDKNETNLIHKAMSYGTIETFEFIIEELKKIASCIEIKNLLSSKGYRDGNLFHSATGKNTSLEFHQCLWNVIEKYFYSSEILELITHCDTDKDHIFHNVVFWNTKEVAEFTWEKIKSYISEEDDQVIYLKQKGHQDDNLIELSKDNQQKDSDMLIWAKYLFDEYQIESNEIIFRIR